MFRVQFGSTHGRLKVEAQPLLDTAHSCPLGQVGKQDEVKADGGRQDAVPAEEVNLDLHGVAQPTKDINVVPTLFVIAAWRVIIDAYFVVKVLIEVGVKLGLQNIFQRAQ